SQQSAPVRREEPAVEAGGETESSPAEAGTPGVTRRELERATGLEDWQLNELESFGLLEPAGYDGGEALYDEESRAVATAAAGFYAHGIGARHLRMYKHFAEREASLFEQVAFQYLRQRNPDARAKAREELATLSKLGGALGRACLAQPVGASPATDPEPPKASVSRRRSSFSTNGRSRHASSASRVGSLPTIPTGSCSSES